MHIIMYLSNYKYDIKNIKYKNNPLNFYTKTLFEG